MNKTYCCRLSVDFNEPIRFGDLPHLIAEAMYPEEGALRYGVARLNLEGELELAAQNREIIVRNAVSLGPSTLLVGEGLKSSVVFAHDIADFLENRLIELVNSPSSPTTESYQSKHKNKQLLQEEAIIKTLIENDFVPKNLPTREPGKSGPKALAKNICLQDRNLFSDKSFDLAWERLRARKDIAGAD